MKICARCQQPIRPGEGRHTIIPNSLSAARPTEYLHKRRCWREPAQLEPTTDPILDTPSPRSR
jgi:hypothetical protein